MKLSLKRCRKFSHVPTAFRFFAQNTSVHQYPNNHNPIWDHLKLLLEQQYSSYLAINSSLIFTISSCTANLHGLSPAWRLHCVVCCKEAFWKKGSSTLIFLTCMWQIHGNLLKKVWISWDLTWPQSILQLKMWEHRTLQNHKLSEDSSDS